MSIFAPISPGQVKPTPLHATTAEDEITWGDLLGEQRLFQSQGWKEKAVERSSKLWQV
jgi:hypothetical protein